MSIRNLLLIVLFAVLMACGKGNSPVPEPEPTPPVVPPGSGVTTKATLILPAQNEVCYAGVVETPTTSLITFKWSAGQNVESYVIWVRDLTTNNSFTTTPLTNNQVQMALTRNRPYSWYIQTKSKTNGEIFESEVWKFFNAGEGVTKYAPYPAEAMFPAHKQSVSPSSGTITLSWRTDDPDGDLANYDIYFGTTTSPPLVLSKSNSIAFKVSVSSGTKYYWKIVSRDSFSYTSESDVFEFTVL